MKNVFQAAILALFMGFPAPVIAGPIDDAEAAYFRDDYNAAFRLYAPLAEQGNVVAQVRLGLMYGNGLGVPQDHVHSANWFLKAAEQGNSFAQEMLGAMYSDGLGVEKSSVEALKWHRRAAEKGRAGAQERLGFAYFVGDGTAPDMAEAVKWFRKSAEQGYALAQSRLGAMYLTGLGVPQDYVLAYMWCNLAASRYEINDTVNRQLAEVNRDRAAAKLTPSQILEAQKLSRDWQPTK